MKIHKCPNCGEDMVFVGVVRHNVTFRCTSDNCDQLKILSVEDDYIEALANVKQLHVALVGIVL